MKKMATNNNAEGEIARFYEDKSIFVTGGTGFMGKVLVRKLLDSCPSIKTVYLLIRPKKDTEPQERLKKSILNTPLFADLDPTVALKLVAIQGDITHAKLGMSDQDIDLIQSNVSVIFHSAATVRFDEELAAAVTMNVEGTKSVLDLAQKMQHLKAIVHVSTAYAHCHQDSINEDFYLNPDFKNLDDIIDQCKNQGDNSGLVGKHPNSYTFTKALAEQLLHERGQNLPLVIVRPSIVIASWKDPFPGWVDNFNGPTGLIAGVSTGLLRTLLVHRDKVADLIPVDVAINVMIVSAWKVAQDQTLRIYNVTSGASNPITWGEVESKGLVSIRKYPFDTVLWYPGGSFKNSALLDKLCRWIFHYLPALLIDSIMTLLRKQPFMLKVVGKMTKAIESLQYFMLREWQWSSSNLNFLRSQLRQTDCHSLETFNFDIRPMNWRDYLDNYVLGTRHYVLKNSPDTLESSRKKMKRLHFLHLLVQFGFLIFILYLFRCIS